MKLHYFSLPFLLTLSLFAQVDVQPASEVSFDTKEGKFYQLQVQVGETWEALGAPVKGTGNKITQTYTKPAKSKFRLQELHKQWVPVWSDEFNGTQLDMTKWAHEENGYGGGNNERQFYSTSEKYSFVKDGKLHLRAYQDPYTTVDGKVSPYSSARLRTLHRGEWKYGRFEIRAKLPNGEGIWPAIWMLPSKAHYGTWASSGEIDIMESRGYDTHMTFGTLHFGDQWPNNVHKGQTHDFPGKKAHEAFHTYVMEWEKDEIRWFLNGKKWQTIKKEDWWSGGAKDRPTAPFDQEFHLIMNLAVGGGNFFEGTTQNPDNMKSEQFPQEMLIDYVRISQWAE